MGGEIRPFRPIRFSTLHLVQNRSHLRGIVIDGRLAWTGGFGRAHRHSHAWSAQRGARKRSTAGLVR